MCEQVRKGSSEGFVDPIGGIPLVGLVRLDVGSTSKEGPMNIRRLDLAGRAVLDARRRLARARHDLREDGSGDEVGRSVRGGGVVGTIWVTS